MSDRAAKQQRNLDFCTRMYTDMLMKFDPTLVDTFIAPDYIQHSTAASEGREGLRAFLDNRREGFPEVEVRIVNSFADGDFCIFQIHTTRFPGDPGMAIVDVFRMSEVGQVQEHWEVLQEIPSKLSHANGMF